MTTFSVSWDYRCPFARNAHEHVVTALRDAAPWTVTFVPFSLNQMHVAEGEPPVWEDESKAPALLAMQAGLVVRDHDPDRFFDAHLALFAARHDHGRDIRERDVLAATLAGAGVDADAVFAEISTGRPLHAFRAEHEAAVTEHKMFGVPTFVAGGQAVFVRLMHRPEGDAGVARATIDRTLELVSGWPDLNEFKHTTIPR